MPHVDAKRTHFGVSFLFSFLSPVPADTPPFQAKALLLGLPTACPSFHSDLQCRNRVCPWAVLSAAGARCGLSSSPCGHRSLCRKARASHRRQSIAAIKVQTGCSSGSKRENQAIKKAAAVRRMPCFVSWEFPVTCGFIPGSGGFPECSAQHRTVRRRAAVKSAAEEAAHRRSKWRYPDQAGMPSVRWQWLYGARH